MDVSKHYYGGTRRPIQPEMGPRSGPSRDMSAEDLHAWSLFRQKLNANFSDSALVNGAAKRVDPPSSPPSNSSIPLHESTVNNILSHPKYGRQLKNQDAFTYLRFGLPRVKATTHQPMRSPAPDLDHLAKEKSKEKSNAALNEELKRRFWNSDSNLLRSSEESDSSAGVSKEPSPPTSNESRNHHPPPPPPHQIDSKPNRYQQSRLNGRMKPAQSVAELRHTRRPEPEINRRSPSFDLDEDAIRMESSELHGAPPLHGSLPPPLGKHPHLVVKDLLYEVDKSPLWRRLCGLSRQKLRILEDISFDIHGGELMGIMVTSAMEGTALLSVLANRYNHRKGTVRAELYLNGVSVSPSQLSRVSAYVSRAVHFCPDMSARQALLFAGLLMGPAERSSNDVKRRTRSLLEELNLGGVRHAKVSQLSESQLRRLHIAVHLLLDTQLLILDQPLQGLDIFDAFFLMEYLRQWAQVGGRSVVMTLSPPTYEVFTMLHRVLLLSAGHALFVGPRRDFLKYFTSLDFPCPPFKNPSDYYLDLVTLDDLSQEALLESSQRVESLVELHARRPLVEIFSAMPGPPAVTPAPYRKANFAMQFLALWIRALIFTFPYNVVHLFTRFVVALFMSLMIGAIYWQVRAGYEQEFVWDRLGFLATMLTVGVAPLIAAELSEALCEKRYVISEVTQGLYSLPAYLIAKTLYSIPHSILIGLAYALPACSMAGLQGHSSPNSLPVYLLLMLAYFAALRSLAFGVAWASGSRATATTLLALFMALFVLSSGVTVQQRDISITHRWMRRLSPVRWLHEALVAWEFEPNSLINSNSLESTPLIPNFVCNRNPVIQQPNAILVRADCGFQTRANILKWFEYQGGTSTSAIRPWWHALFALGVLYLISLLIGFFVFCIRVYYYHQRHPDEARIERDESR